MPVFTPEYLHKVAYHIYRAKGTPEDEAEIVARHLIKANLSGHDSHGIIQTPTYVERIDAGHIVPGAEFEIVKEAPCTAVINGNWGFGFVQTEKATHLAIEKAKTMLDYAPSVDFDEGMRRTAAWLEKNPPV